ncbi:unnamed protein product [Lepidochelys olivacea]
MKGLFSSSGALRENWRVLARHPFASACQVHLDPPPWPGPLCSSHCSLTALVRGFSSQQLQSLKASELVSPGGTVMLSCSLSSGALTDNNYPKWVQQRLGNVPRLIMHSTSTRPSGIPAGFTGSRSGNTMSLTVTGALAEDDADYYCSVWTGSAHHSDTVRWGSDTKTSLPSLCPAGSS